MDRKLKTGNGAWLVKGRAAADVSGKQGTDDETALVIEPGFFQYNGKK